jgi:hypothetical protein
MILDLQRRGRSGVNDIVVTRVFENGFPTRDFHGHIMRPHRNDTPIITMSLIGDCPNFPSPTFGIRSSGHILELFIFSPHIWNKLKVDTKHQKHSMALAKFKTCSTHSVVDPCDIFNIINFVQRKTHPFRQIH